MNEGFTPKTEEAIKQRAHYEAAALANYDQNSKSQRSVSRQGSLQRSVSGHGSPQGSVSGQSSPRSVHGEGTSLNTKDRVPQNNQASDPNGRSGQVQFNSYDSFRMTAPITGLIGTRLQKQGQPLTRAEMRQQRRVRNQAAAALQSGTNYYNQPFEEKDMVPLRSSKLALQRHQ